MKNNKKVLRKNLSFYNILTRDIDEFNKIYLSLFSALFIFFCGLFSYFMTNSFAWFSQVVTSDESINVVVDTCKREKIYEFDKSNANAPVLSENMIPVYYDECDEVWKKADSSNVNSLYKWYNYDEKIWANSVTVTSSSRSLYKKAALGTEIKMDDILTMQVWIPRYKYQVWNYNLSGSVTGNPREIQIMFEEGTNSTGEIECVDDIKGTSNGTVSGTDPTSSEICKLKSNNTNCSDSLCNGKTYTHPAFTFGDKELEGIWVGKFEVSSDKTCTPGSNSAIESGCNLTSIRPLVKPDVVSWRGAMLSVFQNNMMAMNDSGNKYGFDNNVDVHIMKNIEWGVITYLSHSKYGINEEVAANTNNEYLTGCGPVDLDSTSSGTICNSYNTDLGVLSSTTGNVYGIYDLAGGSHEYIAGNMVSYDGITMMSGKAGSSNNYSGYSGIVYDGGSYTYYSGKYNYPDEKYYDKYSYNSVYTKHSTGKLGDATKEVLITSTKSWYNENAHDVYIEGPWSYRGGSHLTAVNAGIFSFSFTNAYANNGRTAHFVLVNF